jgi:polyisoprenoid-binding protein YceI
MKPLTLCLAPALVLAALPLLPGATAPEPTPQPAPAAVDEAPRFAIDTGHSTVMFKVQHLGLSNFYGVFNEFAGEVVHDESDPANSSIELVVQAESVDSRSGDRDKHLRNPDFFNAREFPEITFKSTSITAAGDGYEVTGDLTLRGVTKEITAQAEVVGAGETPFGDYRMGFEARFTIDADDFEMAYRRKMPDALGKDIEMLVSLETIRQ